MRVGPRLVGHGPIWWCVQWWFFYRRRVWSWVERAREKARGGGFSRFKTTEKKTSGSLGSKGAKESSAAIRQTAQYGAFSDVKGEVSHHTPERGLHTGRILYHIEGRIGVR